ncbi:IucA/IucC family protein [Achromobacter xylosoxidans]|uniref:IucA/IucC family protein n=1 Tax=Alcaligenes xylosoxydans xylosoxydans TaxID=85698 RepID=UPI00292CB33A|nr:IucA/IucC family protein [Achromobacter xylosoxidans]WOB71246.1 IucA/IucC family protein [Achromobacter xylosoxidans]
MIEQLVPLLAPIPGVEVIEQLKRELDDSFRNDSLCLAFHDNWNARLLKQTRDAHTDSLLQWLRSPDAPRNPTQLLEQWGTLGHPWHPGYKAKLGMDTREVIGCAPEFEAHVRLPLVALHRGVAHTESMSEPAYPAWWRGAFPHEARTWDSALRTLGREPADFLPLPVHPFQLSTLQETFTAEIAQGQLILLAA